MRVPTVPIVVLFVLIVTVPAPALLTVPLMFVSVKVTVGDEAVLYVRLPVIVTPVKLVGVACATLPVIATPLDNVPDRVTLLEMLPAVIPPVTISV